MRSTSLLLFLAVLFGLSCSDHSLVISPETRMTMDLEKIDKYLADNGIVAQTHPSGLRYVITQQGTGAKATAENCIRVNYTMWFLEKNDPFDVLDNLGLPLSQTILGWRIGLKELQKGGKMRLFIPSALGYGPAGKSSSVDKVIPPNQILIYDVELVNLTTYNAAAGYCNPWPQ
jgi:FKBP-type peptidyl-prolyl cis-trans isomerase FkpA